QSLTGGPRRLLRQLFARLLAHQVLGVPIWPVRVGLPDALLVLAVRGRGAPKCTRQVVRRRKSRRRGVDATGQPLRDFLQLPAVTVRIGEGNEGAVAEMVGLCAEGMIQTILLVIVKSNRVANCDITLQQQAPKLRTDISAS
ncbi:MAG: hypothetical protein QOG67_2635, partial [Verrucomicrobiota bacterium]